MIRCTATSVVANAILMTAVATADITFDSQYLPIRGTLREEGGLVFQDLHPFSNELMSSRRTGGTFLFESPDPPPCTLDLCLPKRPTERVNLTIEFDAILVTQIGSFTARPRGSGIGGRTDATSIDASLFENTTASGTWTLEGPTETASGTFSMPVTPVGGAYHGHLGFERDPVTTAVVRAFDLRSRFSVGFSPVTPIVIDRMIDGRHINTTIPGPVASQTYVPEPSQYLMFGLCSVFGLGLWWRGRKSCISHANDL